MNITRKKILIFIISLIPLFQVYSLDVREQDITLALQSIIVAVATVQGATLLTPEVNFPGSSLEKDASASRVRFTLTNSDIGAMRKQFLSYPPPIAQPKGFFEMLLESVTSYFNNYDFIKAYLQRQHLSEDEILLSGSLESNRIANTSPFRYEGNGSFAVSGSRVNDDFLLDFYFIVPLEGNNRGEIIPLSVLVDGEDALDIALSIFIHE